VVRGRSALLAASLLATLAGSTAAQIAPPCVGGFIQARETWQQPTRLSASVNRVRLIAEGSLPSRFSYRAMVSYEAGVGRTPTGATLRDAYVRWNPAPWSVWVGQFKAPYSREFLTSITDIETVDRSAVVDTLAPKWEPGIMAQLQPGPPLTVSLGVFNGEGQNVNVNRDSTVLVVGRLALRPVAQLDLAGSLAAYGSDSTRYEADLSVGQAGMLLRAELVGQRRRGGSRDDLGWFVLAGYRVLPWMRFVARQEDFQRPTLGTARRISATTAAVDLDLPGGRTRVVSEYLIRKSGPAHAAARSFLTQLQVRF
jgi:hypothetical protein